MESAPTTTMCAACGKEEDKDNNNTLKFCNGCKLVKYCNRDCQVAHRPMHKRTCKQRAAEIYDEQLFKEVEREDCPICFLLLPLDNQETSFKLCCGKLICRGCIYEMTISGGGMLCPFCREQTPRSDDFSTQQRMLKKLMDKDNAYAFYMQAQAYEFGTMGMQVDFEKANELYLKAGKLGCGQAYYNLGLSYLDGNGVEVDKKKAKKYWELSAMKGDFCARHSVGVEEQHAGNLRRAYKHFMISAKAGYTEALDAVTDAYKNGVGLVTKEEYANTLRAYHNHREEVKSENRDKARVMFGTRGL